MSNEKLGTGVMTVIARMETNPEEFFYEAEDWRFIFMENFRDVMTEMEKGALHQALKEVRRKEFDVRVMRTLLMRDERTEGERLQAEQPAMSTNIYQQHYDKAKAQLAHDKAKAKAAIAQQPQIVPNKKPWF